MTASQHVQAGPIRATAPSRYVRPSRDLSRLWQALRSSAHLKRAWAAICMNVLIAVIVATAALTTGVFLPDAAVSGPTWSVRALTLFAIWLLSFVPGWLYVRFLGLRADALWNEYVLNLYRLGVDDVKYLPPPPAESGYAEVRRTRARRRCRGAQHLPAEVQRLLRATGVASATAKPRTSTSASRRCSRSSSARPRSRWPGRRSSGTRRADR